MLTVRALDFQTRSLILSDSIRHAPTDTFDPVCIVLGAYFIEISGPQKRCSSKSMVQQS